MLAPWPYPRWIAHRGAGKLAPENTLAAFRLGAQHGYRMFECDAKLSADGVPFLLHDATLERTTNGRGTGGELPWSALAQLDAGSWHSRAYAGEPLSWDIRCTPEHWDKWLKKPPTMMDLGVAYTTGKMKFEVGDYSAMIKDPRMAGPFIKSFAAMSRVG